MNNKFICWKANLMGAEEELNENLVATACWAEGSRTKTIRRPGFQAGFPNQAPYLRASLPSCTIRGLENKTFSAQILQRHWLWLNWQKVRFTFCLQRLPDNNMKSVPFPTLSPLQRPHPTSSPSEQLSWSFVQNPTATQSGFPAYRAVFCALSPRWHRRPCLGCHTHTREHTQEVDSSKPRAPPMTCAGGCSLRGEICFWVLLARCQMIRHHCAPLAFHVKALKYVLEFGLTAGHSSRAGNSMLCFHVGSMHRNKIWQEMKAQQTDKDRLLFQQQEPRWMAIRAPCLLLRDLEHSVNPHSPLKRVQFVYCHPLALNDAPRWIWRSGLFFQSRCPPH